MLWGCMSGIMVSKEYSPESWNYAVQTGKKEGELSMSGAQGSELTIN